MKKIRLDILMVEHQLAESRTLAQRLVMAGQVRVHDQVALKPSQLIDPEAEITVDKPQPFVSRGGEKLLAALTAFHLDNLKGYICVDIGASTGGFTDCLLQHGAERVYTVDVGYGILHWKIRNNPRVVVMEKTNARLVTCFPEPIQLVTVDASFISLSILLPPIKKWIEPGNEVVTLIKPLFEVGRAEAAKTEGVIRDPLLHRKVIVQTIDEAKGHGFYLKGLIRSPLLGPKGNTEFLAYWTLDPRIYSDDDFMIKKVFEPENPSEKSEYEIISSEDE